MIFEHHNYRHYLRSILIERQRENQRYSMRAFARQLGLGQSALSQVLAGKKNLSLEATTRIAQQLKLNQKESEYLRVLVLLEKAKAPDYRAALLTQAQAMNGRRKPKDLSLDLFASIADWYHLAIRNMTDLRNFKFNAQQIAKRLGITELEAKDAIERLLRLELIEPDAERTGRMRRGHDYVLARSGEANEALRKFHRQMLNKAIAALESQAPQEKFVGSETFAISPEQLPQFFALADEFLTKMSVLSRGAKSPVHVYHLGLQFFNLTRGKT